MTQLDPLLLAVARAGLPGAAPPPVDGWEEHLERVIGYGLAGLFAASAAAGRVEIDAAMAARLQRQLDAEAIRAVQLEGELLRLASLLEHLGAVVLKGPVLAHAAYPDPLLRPFTDLDVLVPGVGVADAIAAFATYGYQRTRPEPAPGFDARVGKAVTLRHPGGVIVDLHRTLAAGNAGEGVDVHELLAARRQVRIGPQTVPAPSWEAHLVECALHAVVGDGLARPLSLRDIAEVAHHPLLDAGVAGELALRWQAAELVGLGLRAARDGLGIELPNALAALAHRADLTIPESDAVRSAQSRLDELSSGDLRRRATLARSLIAPSAEFLRWAHGDASLPRLYGRRWRSLYERALEAREGQAPEASHPADPADGTPPAPDLPTPSGDSLPTLALGAPAAAARLPAVSRPTAGTLQRAGPVSRQEAWSRARPPRQRATTNGNGPNPQGAGGGGGTQASDNGDGQGGGDDDGSGPPAASPASDHDPTRGTAPAAPPRNGVAFGVAGGALLGITAIGSQIGNNDLGVVLVPLAALLLASAASRRITRLRPDEAWVGRWLVLAVAVKLGASYFRYHTALVSYGGIADATGYDDYGRRLASAWLNGGNAPDLDNLRETNFIRWFTGAVYYLFGTNMVAGFFVFGLLALLGSYFWYRATVDAVPRVNKRLYLGLVLFAPSVAFWPSSIGKESLMQLGVGAVALATAHLLRHRLGRAAVLGAAGGWLLWVVRPHLLALVTLAAGCAYAGGRVRSAGGAMRSLMARPVGLLAVVLVMAFTVSQATEFLGMEDLSLSSIEAELDE
ncbi:MAG: nucleotidyltransferase family protein, partial [Acidimicrobiales bacterium]